MAHIAELLGANTEGLTVSEAAESAVEQVIILLKELNLSDGLKEEQSYGVDLELFGKNASEMFLIRNNPRKASVQDCIDIFTKVFKN